MDGGIAVLGGMLLAAFLYFLYTKITESKGKKSTSKSGGGRGGTKVK